MNVKTYRVVDGPLGVREEATVNSKRSKEELPHGAIVTVKLDPVHADGYIWIQHADGWSAVATDDMTDVYMMDITDRDPNEPYLFKVWASRLSIRKEPRINAPAFPKKLRRRQVIEVKPDSRTEADGYVWWQHGDGLWSAECSVLKDQIFLKETFERPSYLPVSETQKVPLPKTLIGKLWLQATENHIKARSKPTTDKRVQINRYLWRGQAVECDFDDVRESDNYYWVKHNGGWTAVQHVTGKPTFLAEPGTIPGIPRIGPDGIPVKDDLPMLEKLIHKWMIPLETIGSFQYYGNNVFAVGHAHSYYRNTQGLHSGIDFNTNGGETIVAGVYGKFVTVQHSTPGNTKVIVRGVGAAQDYTFIYQHVIPAGNLKKGMDVTPNTKIGLVQKDGTPYNPHLHFEIRYGKPWVVNPIWFLPQEMKDDLYDQRNPKKPNKHYRYNTKYVFFYYNPEKWTQWITPEDQPMIRLGGERLGPTSKYRVSQL